MVEENANIKEIKNVQNLREYGQKRLYHLIGDIISRAEDTPTISEERERQLIKINKNQTVDRPCQKKTLEMLRSGNISKPI